MISHAIYEFNGHLVCYSSHDLNNGPFIDSTCLDHLNTKLVHYSDPHCTYGALLQCLGAVEAEAVKSFFLRRVGNVVMSQISAL